MNWKLPTTIIAVLALGGGLAYYLLTSDSISTASAREHGDHDEHAESDEQRGPHGGRLLVDGNLTLELTIFEQGISPEFRAWFSQAGKSIPPSAVKLTVELKRPDGVTDHHTFAPESDYLRGNAEVYEPHSFDYVVVAEHAGATHRWQFAAPEMQTTISPEAAARAGVAIESVGPATMTETLAVYGQVKLNTNKIARAVPRFGGIVREARKAIGDPVAAGEVIAIVETNQAFVALEVKAPLAGVIVDRDVNAGETVGDGATLYTIADLTDVWIDLNIPKRDHSRVQVGQTVTIEADDGGAPVRGIVAWIAPTGSAEAQTLTARVVLPNPEHRWHAGLFVKAEVTISEITVPVAVKLSALQTLFDFTVVFSQHGEIYQARPLELGRRSGGQVEVLRGLKAGELYVTGNSFLLKADLGKSGASHDH